MALLAALALAGRGARAQTFVPAEDRVRAWREDLDSSVAVFLHKRDRTFSPVARAAFERDVAQLRDSAATLRDDQIVVRLAADVARSGNAHTRLYLARNRSAVRRYPLRVWWFDDGLYVVRTDSQHRALLGGKVARIAGRSPQALARAVGHLYAGNASWQQYMSTYTMTSPEILRGLDLIANDTLDVEVVSRSDRRRVRSRITPLPLVRGNDATEAWWDLAPQHPGRGARWVSALAADTARLPLYLLNPEKNYWFTYLAAERTLYLSYQRSADQEGGEPTSAFGDRFLAEVRDRDPRKLVIDVRFNTGGDLTKSEAFLKSVAALPLARERGRLFVIVGRATFSAGIYAAALLKELAPVTVVGEPVGDRLDFWSEGGNYVMPNSKLSLHYADRFHSYSPAEYPERRPYDRDLSVKTLAPDLPVHLTAAEYFAGRDPALAQILRRPER
jgi:hypothetical protein